jgi:hypothetical protein
MKRLLVLCEGLTEWIFVRDVLAPHLEPRGLTPIGVEITTKRPKAGGSFRGGITGTEQVVSHLRRLLGDRGVVAVTTMIDYYGLRPDFLGMGDRPQTANAHQRVEHVERRLGALLGDRRFIPHLTLHEFEAWIFTAPSRCASFLTNDATVAAKLDAIRDKYGGPERINDGPSTAPSKQLARIVPEYHKALHGPRAVAEIGLAAIREACPHADGWLRRLESL